MDLLCEVKFAKNVLLNLAGCGLRKLVDEPPGPRDLVRGQTFSTELRQFLLGDLMPRLDLDKSDGHFAPVAIRNPDDRSSHDGGMGVENVLDLAGIDILAAADDHVLAPALNAAISVLVETPQIAGVKPAFGIDCRSRRFRIVEIVFHDGVSASADFADLSDRHNRAGFRTDDLDFGLRHGPADR